MHVRSTVAEAAAGEHVWGCNDSRMRLIHSSLMTLCGRIYFILLFQQLCVLLLFKSTNLTGINCFRWIFTFISSVALCFSSLHCTVVMNFCLLLGFDSFDESLEEPFSLPTPPFSSYKWVGPSWPARSSFPQCSSSWPFGLWPLKTKTNGCLLIATCFKCKWVTYWK